MILSFLSPAMLMLLSPVIVAAPEGAVADQPSAATNAEIAAHNAALNPRDPDFIRCRRIAVPGSLVKKARVCKTNRQWARAWTDGNQNARDTYDAMNRGSTSPVEPPDEFTAPGAQNRPN